LESRNDHRCIDDSRNHGGRRGWILARNFSREIKLPPRNLSRITISALPFSASPNSVGSANAFRAMDRRSSTIDECRASVNSSERAVRNNRSDAARAREYRSLRYKHITQMGVFLSKSPLRDECSAAWHGHALAARSDRVNSERESAKGRNLGRESQTPDSRNS